MLPSVTLATVFGLLFGLAHAKILSIKVSNSSNVIAGSDTKVTIELGEPSDPRYAPVNFTVGIYSSAVNFPICNLIASVPASKAEFTVSIPPSLGPSGYLYRIWVTQFNSENIVSSDNGELYSSIFRLHNATGVFTTYEVIPYGFFGGTFYGDSDKGIPLLECSMYDCARQCYKLYPASSKYNGPYSSDTTIIDSRYITCLEACPGAPIPFPKDGKAETTTLTSAPKATATSTITDVQPDPNCDVENGHTSCGRECCAVGIHCFYWNNCLGSDDSVADSVSFTISGGSFPTSTGTTTAGGLGISATTVMSTSSSSRAQRTQVPGLISGVAAIARACRYI